MHFKILKYISKMKYPAKNPAKFLKPEPEPDIEAGYPAGSGFLMGWQVPIHRSPIISMFHFKYDIHITAPISYTLLCSSDKY